MVEGVSCGQTHLASAPEAVGGLVGEWKWSISRVLLDLVEMLPTVSNVIK